MDPSFPPVPPAGWPPAQEYVPPPVFVDSEPAEHKPITLPVKTHLVLDPRTGIEQSETPESAGVPPSG